MANGNVAFLSHDKDTDTLTIRLPDAHVRSTRVSAIVPEMAFSYDETGGIVALSLGKASQFDLDRWLEDTEHHTVPSMLKDHLTKWKKTKGEGIVQTAAALPLSNINLPQSSAELPPSEEQPNKRKGPSHWDAQAVSDTRSPTSQGTTAPELEAAGVAPPDVPKERTHAGNAKDHEGNIKHEGTAATEPSRKKHEGKAGTG